MNDSTHLVSRGSLAVALVLSALVGPARAQLSNEQMADMVLTSARKAFNEKNYPFAATRFREFLAKFGGHKEAASARYGLALSLLDGPEKDRNFGEIQQFLSALAQDKSFADQPLAAYYLGQSLRSQGIAELVQADAKPQEAANRRSSARQKFEQALGPFAQAVELFRAQAKEPGEKDLSTEWEWVARARGDLAEMQVRTGKVKEARATAEPFVKDSTLSRSRYRDFGRYLFAHAAFLENDLPAAQKTLTMLAPFTSREFGTHARYLLARTHHLSDERPEATLHYDGTVNDHKQRLAEVAALLKQPQQFKNDPAIRAELETFQKAPAPDHVARASFYLGVLFYEAGKFAEAKSRFAEFLKAHPESPLKVEVDLRIGFCQVQGKEFGEAIKTLERVVDREPKLADQALLWLARAKAGAAPDAATKPNEHKQSITSAVNILRQALTRAQQLGDAYPDAKGRRGLIVLEMADQLQAIKEYRDAAQKYQELLSEKLLPEREEEIAVRLCQAQHLTRDYDASDRSCQSFERKYPHSTLLPVVAFTYAENAYFRAAAAEKTGTPADRAKLLPPLFEETLKRAQAVVDKYPEYPKILLVRHTMALTHYRQDALDKAFKAWNDIPASERAGELASVPFLMADCILRQTPTAVPEDALAAGKLEEQLKSSAELLEAFLGSNPKDANAPDALLKFGLCQQRLAALLAQPPEKKKALGAARAAYERLAKDFKDHPLQPQAVYERAKVLLLQGDSGNGLNELRRFTTDPLQKAKVAPIAVVALATQLRAQNKASDAVELLQKARDQHEGALASDPQRAGWAVLLRFHHAAALREAGKLPQARELFDSVTRQSPKSPEGIEAMLRQGQCLKEEGLQRVAAGRKGLASIKRPEDAAQVESQINEGYKTVRDAVAYLEKTAETLNSVEGVQEVRARMYYEAAWGLRHLADQEIAAAKTGVAREMVKKMGATAAKLPLPAVPLDKVPLQPAEKQARGVYKGLIERFGDVPLSVDARFELAELLADRGEHDAAVALLNDALDKEPSPELTEKVRLRLGVVHAAKGNLKGAMAQFEAVVANPKSPLIGWAHYRVAEIHLQNKDYGEAVKRLTLFRDNGQFQNVPGLSDRALLRLGHAYALVKGWNESAQAMQRLLGAFPNSPWADEARYGMGWALQHQGNHDGAANWYGQVVGRSVTELAAKAQFQIGMCRLSQKRPLDAANAFLVVSTTYDYPELTVAALLEAARAYSENNQRDQSTRLLERIIREYPNTPFAEVAKERLEQK